ncbi:hypothetical protein EJ110_NYTH24213 [Nymphaea thermarum]|nr:hypothetical protein EJ110_NYTH24213 [Nymphaea thermarum]
MKKRGTYLVQRRRNSAGRTVELDQLVVRCRISDGGDGVRRTGGVAERSAERRALRERYGGDDLPHGNFFFDGELPLTIKRQSQPRTALAIFTSTLTSIDFSDNRFTGRIPEEMGALKLLYSLNLSWNNLDGPIPKSFGDFQGMESLDLSHNHLSGSIPEELTKDTFLSVLDLSYNNLQGRIPQGNQLSTFGDASFVGNEGLCGSPLPISCPNSNSGSRGSINGVEEKADQDPHWEYLAAGIGFAACQSLGEGDLPYEGFEHSQITIMSDVVREADGPNMAGIPEARDPVDFSDKVLIITIMPATYARMVDHFLYIHHHCRFKRVQPS